MGSKGYDVVIVGCGPAGIFSAYELTLKSSLKVLMVDKGPDIGVRKCKSDRGTGCLRCDPCPLLTGWGGAGSFSDGKLTLSTEVGGWLREYVSEEELRALIDYVDSIYLKFGAPKELYGTDIEKIEDIERRAAFAGLKLLPSKIRHLGTDNSPKLLERMRDHLKERADIMVDAEVKDVLVRNGRVEGIETAKGERIAGRNVILAPGRIGAEWLKSTVQRLGLRTLNNPVDIGVRVEVPAPVMEELTDALYEPKFIYYSKAFDDKVRVFCVCPNGEVITESYDDVLTVNGQSYSERKTGNTNFAILVSTSFTEPFKEPIAYGKYIAKMANLLGGGILVQRLGDLDMGRRSTAERIERNTVSPTLKSFTPGDLSFVLPYRHLSNIREMLKAMDQVCPGVYSKHTLLYGVEVKFYSSKLELTKGLETRISGLYAIGDGAGVSRGLVQASASGIIAAREILRKAGS